MAHLGIDPGRTGAAVLISTETGTVVYALEWKPHKDGYSIRYEPGKRQPVATLLDVMALVAVESVEAAEEIGEALEAVAVEAFYLTGQRSGRTMITSAEARGVMREVAAFVGAPLYEPTPSQWRRAVMGHGGAKRAEAKVRAKRAAADDGFALCGSDHAAEAMLIARYARQQEAT